MKKVLLKIVKNPLISGSTIVFVGTNAGNAINYIFNIIVARSLGVQDYSIFASLISILNILFVFAATISLVFTKFTASYIAQDKEYMVGVLLRKGTKWISYFSLILCTILFLLGESISTFLHIGSIYFVYIVILSIFIAFITSVLSGILQGSLKFLIYSFFVVLSSLVKLLSGVLLIFIGFKVGGAIGAFLVTGLTSYIFLLVYFKKYFHTGNDNSLDPRQFRKSLVTYAVPVFLSQISFTAYIAVDIILVRHFLSEQLSGQYAALSLMGRSIFYFVGPISFVLFPLIAQKKERKENVFTTLLLALCLVAGPMLVLSAIYFVYPQIIIQIFFPGGRYTSITPDLGFFSLFIIFYGLAFLLNNFYFSVGKTKVAVLTLIALLLETVYLFLFHSSINQIVVGLTVIMFLLLLSLLLYYPYGCAKRSSIFLVGSNPTRLKLNQQGGTEFPR